MISQQVKITFIKGPRSGEEIFFNNEHKITFGRDPNCDVSFSGDDNPTVSRNHADLMYTNETWLLVDQSKNGTLVGSEMIHQSEHKINDEDTIQFSKSGESIKVEFSSIVSEEPDKSVPTDETSPSRTKILPMSKTGFVPELLSQPFFWPGVITVITGVMMFFLYILTSVTEDLAFLNLYQLVLGVYIGLITIYFIINVASIKVPFWIPIGSALFTILMFIIGIPFVLLEIIFRPPFIEALVNQHTSFVGSFIGHFVGAGLIEELFKVYPVMIALACVNQFRRLNISGFEGGRLSPTLAVVIGSSSAVGFMLIETLGQYVPDTQSEEGLVLGFMLLIPRLVSGIAGHAAYSGIFSYFIALGFYYKRKSFYYPFVGWLLASALHGLWNSSFTISVYLSPIVALGSFIIFISYLFKARQSFS